MKTNLHTLLAAVTTVCFFLPQQASSQSGAKWATGGNALSTGDFFGSTTNFPIDFKTNNVSRMTLSTVGVLKINNLAGIGSRLLQTDASGNIIFLPAGLSNQVLYGTGAWGALPAIPTPVWQQNGSNIFFNNGFVGINTSFPMFPLDIIGDARISNNLYVGGGIIITDRVHATTEVRAKILNVDSIKLGAGRAIYGETSVFGNVILKQQFQVTGSAVFNGAVQASNLNVSGNTNFGNDATVNGVLTTNTLNVNGAFMATTLNVGTATNNVNLKVQTNGSGATTLGFGYGISTIPSGPASCVTPYTGPMTASFNGRSVITAPIVTGTEPVFDFRNDALNGSIDYGFDYAANPNPIQRTGSTTIPSIKINGSCWGDVEIAKGGGFVSTGNHFEVGNPVSSYLIASNILGNSRIGQRVTLNTNLPDALVQSNPALTNYNTQLFVNKNLTRALSVFNTITNTAGDENFVIFGDGKTQINATVKANKYFTVIDVSTTTPVEVFAINGSGYVQINTPNPTLPVNVIDVHDLTNNKDLFRVKSNGHVYAREVEILNTSTPFPDYVFAKDYKLLTLPELENYITKNNHLPSFESASYYESNGIKSSEMFIKQQEKIEELTLYIIELEKRMKAIESKLK